ncbi:MAG: hypothetical protein CVV64_02240 [Candidatus Wallbacteria bacterium HGW-Wallbacteria-1]|jgi:anthranilate/para-aminobenzoate synthase component I|uniref:Uncharacterized protein n=1 Tax=Candidatus Wallbacteria bacterium HGW-Wallbacteria-1 TaxID=2013854 RepID=A0A2N1PV85_9BACT|nr:MAG: hypothetical protein CVV64_02240 [Candidatus Wallbacteria bacterium HGW-Wallbacteria-1]
MKKASKILRFITVTSLLLLTAYMTASYSILVSDHLSGKIRIVAKDNKGFTRTYVNLDREVTELIMEARTELDAIMMALNWKKQNPILSGALSSEEFDRLVKDCYQQIRIRG